MIRQLAIISFIALGLGCSAPQKEQRARIPDNTYRPSGFHAFINHGTGNVPISLAKDDSLYHLFYTTGADEWGHLTSADLLSWKPKESFPLSKHGYGGVVLDKYNTSGLNAPWNILLSDGGQLNLSFSADGQVWNDFEDNPVLTAKGNPSVSWSADLERWILTVSNENKISFYTSENLIEWSSASTLDVDTQLNKVSLVRLGRKWLLLAQGEKLQYQTGSFDGASFVPTSDWKFLEGIQAGPGAILNLADETVIISKTLSTNAELPTFSTPLTMTLQHDQLYLFPAGTFQNEIVGKRRTKLGKLFTDGPSWYNFVIEQDFEEIEIVISDNTSDVRILWNKPDKKMILSGSALRNANKELDANFIAQDLIVDVLIDHATVDIFFNNGAYSTTLLTLPDTFFSKVEVFLDGEKYDAKGVLYDIGI